MAFSQTHNTEQETEAQGKDLQRSHSQAVNPGRIGHAEAEAPQLPGPPRVSRRGPLTRCRSLSASARWASSCCLHWAAAALASRRAPANLLLLSCSAKNSASHCTSPTELQGRKGWRGRGQAAQVGGRGGLGEGGNRAGRRERWGRAGGGATGGDVPGERGLVGGGVSPSGRAQNRVRVGEAWLRQG